MEAFLADRYHGMGFLLGYAAGELGEPGVVVSDTTRREVIGVLKRALADCEGIGLRVSILHITEEIHRLETTLVIESSKLSAAILAVSDTVRREMKSGQMFRLSPETQHYFDANNPFGRDVAGAFTRAEYDIVEAGKCLALSRATACVFHAMRVLEHGLGALAAQFNLPFEHKSWGEIIEPIEKAIRQINQQKNKPPDWKNDEQFYSETASQFMHFKNAWRNYTAHLQFKYTETEAEAIYRHVRDFMQHISKRLKEAPIP